MHHCSETIGAIAAALAKAQGELANPEKSLTGTIHSPLLRGGERSFRYAPLSSGLEIVRKVLSKHEIATVQTTAIDGEAGLIRLTTVLAHSSGEWLSSDWPVCPVSETGAPHRMGAALTYARRYALFTLVGIAGEDDLDAPDLAVSGPPGSSVEAGHGGRTNGGALAPSPAARRQHRTASAQLLAPTLSATLCEQLLSELSSIESADQAAVWAHRRLPAKNTLLASDARVLEEAFRARVAALGEPADDLDNAGGRPSPAVGDNGPPVSRTKRGQRARSTQLDKTALALPEPRRLRDKSHVKFVSGQPCLVCGRQPADAHHARIAQHPALGRKVSDEFTVPLCRAHHREVHRSGDEARWWKGVGVEPLIAASGLWAQTHPLRTPAGASGVFGISEDTQAEGVTRTPKAAQRAVNYKTNPIRSVSS